MIGTILIFICLLVSLVVGIYIGMIVSNHLCDQCLDEICRKYEDKISYLQSCIHTLGSKSK
jgi:hypothetical protein